MPRLNDKETIQLDGNTVFRRRAPTNADTARKFTNMKLPANRGREVVPVKVAQSAMGPLRKTNPSGSMIR